MREILPYILGVVTLTLLYFMANKHKKSNKLIHIIRYIEPIWLGKDGKASGRRVLALMFSLDLIYNFHSVINKGSSLSEATMLLGIEAGLIAGLLSLTTFSPITPKSETIIQYKETVVEQESNQEK